jgi:hypothetical protein
MYSKYAWTLIFAVRLMNSNELYVCLLELVFVCLLVFNKPLLKFLPVFHAVLCFVRIY